MHTFPNGGGLNFEVTPQAPLPPLATPLDTIKYMQQKITIIYGHSTQPRLLNDAYDQYRRSMCRERAIERQVNGDVAIAGWSSRFDQHVRQLAYESNWRCVTSGYGVFRP